MASIIEEIKSNVDIVEYIEQYVDLTVKGNNHVGLCPFHQDSDPSFKVSPSKRIFKCFGCGKGGNIFNFVTLYHKVDFGEAIRILSDYLGFKESDEYDGHYEQMKAWHKYFMLGHNTFSQQYLVDRNIEYMTYSHFEVGFIPDAGATVLGNLLPEIVLKLGVIYQGNGGAYRFKFPGCLTFPFFDDQDRIVGFSFMRIDRRPDEPKYENSWTTPIFKRRDFLFGLKQTCSQIKNRGVAHLVEGYFDVMRMYQNTDDKEVVGVCGSTMTDEQVSLINKHAHSVRINFDGDEAGREGAIKSAFKCEEKGLEVFIGDFPDGSDPDNFFAADVRNVLRTIDVPRFFFKYNTTADAVDVLLAHASKVKNLDTVEYYIKAIKEEYPSIPISLITARMSRTTVISEKYKAKPSEFSIQRELIKAVLQGLLSPEIFDENKFNNECRPKIAMLKANQDEFGFINLDSSIMAQFTEFLEPLNVAVEELPKLALPYRKFDNIDELIKAKKVLHQ